MNMKEFFKDKKVIIPIVFFIVLIVGTIVFVNSKNDGMKNIGDISIYYRTFTSKNGWSKWSKNGIISGNIDGSPIKNIEIKIKSKHESDYSYSVYTKEKGWIEDNTGKYDINAFRLDLYGVSSKKYDVCYRTYNKKDKWLDWSCNYTINGNALEHITALEVKIIPKHVIKKEYLKDFSDSGTNNNLNFD